MAKAKKLPSGSWRVQAYSHTDSTGKIHRVSIIGDTKKEAEFLAAEYALNKKRNVMRDSDFTLAEAIDDYIKNSDAVLSPTTLAGYRLIKKNSFQSIMNVKLKKLNVNVLQSAVNEEAKRPTKNKKGTLSPKSVANNYGLITAVINRYMPDANCDVKLPKKVKKIKELPPPEVIFDIIKGTEIELPVLLAMWLSFSMSEILGLTKSKSINDGYITIREVSVCVDGQYVTKDQAKAFERTRRHRIPEYIQQLIDNTDPTEDKLITLSGHAIYNRLSRLLEKNNVPHITFHDLRHVNASVMAMLRIPDKYAQERGGWKTDKVMKQVYMHTFSDERKVVDDIIDNYFNESLIKETAHETSHGNKKTP